MNNLITLLEKIKSDINYKDNIDELNELKSMIISNHPFIGVDDGLISEESKTIIDLLKSDKWPEAIFTYQICDDTEEDKIDRADGILDYLGNVLNKNVLDFGCGEGHVSYLLANKASKSTGYDLLQSGNFIWEKVNKNLLLTTDFEKVKMNAPYDLIILYDVLDHVENPQDVLKKVAEVCNKDTKVFVRCHSWMSRHGGHLYKKLNKAWIQLFLTEEELDYLGLKVDTVQKYYFPLKTHGEWFEAAGFKIISSDVIKSGVEAFFRNPILANRVSTETFKLQFPEFQMSQSFNDYYIGLI